MGREASSGTCVSTKVCTYLGTLNPNSKARKLNGKSESEGLNECYLTSHTCSTTSDATNQEILLKIWGPVATAAQSFHSSSSS